LTKSSVFVTDYTIQKFDFIMKELNKSYGFIDTQDENEFKND